MDIEDVPVVGSVLSSGAVVLDIFAAGGDFVFSIATTAIMTVVSSPEILLPVVEYGRKALEALGINAPGAVDTVLASLAVALFVASTGKLILRITKNA